MLEFGRFIRKLERLQSPHPLLFMAENVLMKDADLAEAREAFAVDFGPIEFDAAYVSPTRRKRVFFTNIPPRLAERFVYDGVESYLGPSSCLETGFKLPAHIVDSEENSIAKVRQNAPVHCHRSKATLLTRTNGIGELSHGVADSIGREVFHENVCLRRFQESFQAGSRKTTKSFRT